MQNKSVVLFKILVVSCLLLSLLLCKNLSAQDTIHWKSNYKLQWKDFQGKPDTTVIDLAVCASEITYQYKVVNGKLTFSIDCFFDKKRSWIKHNMNAILDHEQGHFDISKLFSLKLKERFQAYKLNTATVEQDLIRLYNQTIQERTKMHERYDKETASTSSDKLQKQFITIIRKQIIILQKQLGCK